MPKQSKTPDSPNRSEEHNRRFLRLPQVLERIPVSKSTWWLGVKVGRFPKPVKLSPRTTAWREADIDAFCGQREGAGHE
jgi:prophage regulatory protein